MLNGLLGTRLLFWVGTTVPAPPSSDVIDALTSVEVTQDESGASGFQVQFALSANSLGDYAVLTGGALDPLKRVWIAVIMGVTPEVLMDGIITHHQITPAVGGGSAMLTITGQDVSVMLDLEEKTEKYENQPDFVIVAQVLANYAAYGLLPAVIPTVDVPIMLQRTPWQTESDLAFIQRLARRNGYVFYVEPTTLGVNTAYFGPPTRAALPLSALTLGMGQSNNLQSIHFTTDALAPIATESTMFEPISKAMIPIPSPPTTRLPPFASSPVPARTKRILRSSAKLSPALAASAASSGVSLAPEAVTAEGEVDTVRYGSVLRARRSVGVRGVGTTYGGQYWVNKVTHKIDRSGSYTQKFTLKREGTGALLPVVLP